MKQRLITDLPGIRYPFIQAPMLGITTPEMVAAVADSGGLGSLPIGGLAPEQARALIRQTKALTGRPFAVNFFAHTPPVPDEAAVMRMRALLEALCAAAGLEAGIPAIDQLHFHTYRDQLDVLLEAAPPVVSFTFGIPDRAAIQALKEEGCLLMGTATCTEEARLLEAQDIDMICVQGIEAGGHRGTFIGGALPQVGTMALLPQVMDAVGLPVIAAGGISDGRTIRAALTLGAVAVQVGTAFLGCTESSAIDAYKARLQTAADTDTALTRAFSGRWARGIRNRMMEALDEAGIAIPPYPVQNSLTGLLRAGAQAANNADFTNLWAGQYIRKDFNRSVQEAFVQLLQEAGLMLEAC